MAIESSGQPTMFGDHIVDEVENYLETYDTAIPTKAGLSLHLGVDKKTIDNWKKLNPEKNPVVSSESLSQYIRLLSKLEAMQEVIVVDKGLSGDFNSAMSKLILTKHGYSDKIETDNVTTIDLSNYTTEQLERMAE